MKIKELKNELTLITVTQKNINHFHPYQGTKRVLEIGDKLSILKSDVPCVTHRRGSGRSLTFTIVLGEIQKKYDKDHEMSLYASHYSYAFDRWSINNRYVPAKSRRKK